jgi:hypothetical protein
MEGVRCDEDDVVPSDFVAVVVSFTSSAGLEAAGAAVGVVAVAVVPPVLATPSLSIS